MIISVPLLLCISVISFLEMENDRKVKISTAVLIAAEIIFWSGGFLEEKELFTKYKSYFNPKNWFGNHKDKETQNEEG